MDIRWIIHELTTMRAAIFLFQLSTSQSANILHILAEILNALRMWKESREIERNLIPLSTFRFSDSQHLITIIAITLNVIQQTAEIFERTICLFQFTIPIGLRLHQVLAGSCRHRLVRVNYSHMENIGNNFSSHFWEASRISTTIGLH